MTQAQEHITYNGAINEDIGSSLTQLVLTSLTAYLHHASDAKKCGSVALELIDNAQRYSPDGRIMFEITNLDGAVCIKLVNLAEEKDAFKLKKAADYVQNLSNTEAQKLYKEQLLSSTFGERGGAGLGFLFIKRKGVNKFDVEIHPAEEGHYICECKIELNLTTPS
jgi:hypothetical protein